MNHKTLKTEIHDSVAIIKLNRPDVLNAFNKDLIFDLTDATDLFKNDLSIKVLIIIGEGNGFCSGADLAEQANEKSNAEDALMMGFKPIFENIINMPKPVIAAIHGPAAGIGAALALACDLRIMTKNAYLLSVFSNIGLIPDGGLNWLLPRFIGYGKAYEYAIEAKKISSDECFKFGIANKLVEDCDIKEESLKWANTLSKRPSQSLINTKKLMRDSFSKNYWETFSQEAKIQKNLVGSQENLNAIKKFFKQGKHS